MLVQHDNMDSQQNTKHVKKGIQKNANAKILRKNHAKKIYLFPEGAKIVIALGAQCKWFKQVNANTTGNASALEETYSPES